QRGELERLDVGDDEHGTQAKADAGLVAQELREPVEVLAHLRSRRGRAGQERDRIHRQRLDPRVLGDHQLADERERQADRLEREPAQRAPDGVAEVELRRGQAAVHGDGKLHVPMTVLEQRDERIEGQSDGPLRRLGARRRAYDDETVDAGVVGGAALGVLPTPISVRLTADSSSAKSGSVVRSTNRPKPSLSARRPRDTRSGSVVSRRPASRAAGVVVFARTRGVSRSTSGKRPDASRSKSTHGFSISTLVTRTAPGHCTSMPAARARPAVSSWRLASPIPSSFTAALPRIARLNGANRALICASPSTLPLIRAPTGRRG